MDQIIRVAKLSTFGEIAASAEHTYRERPTPNAHPKLTPFNVCGGAKGSKEVQKAIKERLETVKVKDDSVLCLEYLVTASPEFFKVKTAAEIEAYWEKTDAWMFARHGKKNVIASNLQLDESTPHKVYYVVPIVETIAHTVNKRVIASKKDLDDGIAKLGKDGKTPEKIIQISKSASSKLSAKHYNGGARKLSELQTDFYENVSKSCGLARGVEGSKAKHQSVKRWYGELEPRIADAKHVIDGAEKVKQAQDEREAALILKSAEVIQRAQLEADKLRLEAENWLRSAEEHIEKKEEKLRKQAGQNEKFRLFLNGVADGLKTVFRELPETVFFALPEKLQSQLVEFFKMTPIQPAAALEPAVAPTPLVESEKVAGGLLSTLSKPLVKPPTRQTPK